MTDNNPRFISSAVRASDVDGARAEPSHIHIARPSRVRRDSSGSSVEPLDAVRDPAAAEVTVQAA